MLFSDYLNTTYNGKLLPDYYDFMYLDGYTPDEVMVAHHRTMMKRLEALHKEREQVDEIKISSMIKIK